MTAGVQRLCRNCAHFREGLNGPDGGRATCWRYPPQFPEAGCSCGVARGGRPRVHGDSWCGEFAVLVEPRTSMDDDL